LLGGQQSTGAYPAPLTVKVKPFPWPAKQEDLGAASAAAFFNLLLVYAFMAPTRAVVGSIVREKELRLREGMRILGLSVSRQYCLPQPACMQARTVVIFLGCTRPGWRVGVSYVLASSNLHSKVLVQVPPIPILQC
jgi:hypothetical protein